MPNTYVNKVQLADGTSVIDISDTTALASDVASGKYFYGKDGAKTQGTATGGSISDTVTTLPSGGDYHAITGATISGTINIAQNGTYDVTQYASAVVNVSGGGTIETVSFTVKAETSDAALYVRALVYEVLDGTVKGYIQKRISTSETKTFQVIKNPGVNYGILTLLGTGGARNQPTIYSASSSGVSWYDSDTSISPTESRLRVTDGAVLVVTTSDYS